MPKSSVGASNIIQVTKSHVNPLQDLLAVEEPLEIRLGYGDEVRKEISLAVTMRTPGHDFDLVTGFLISEAVISNAEEIVSIVYCENTRVEEKGNVVRVELHPSMNVDVKKLQRHFYTSSSCGVCGKTSIESVHSHCQQISDNTKIVEQIIHNAPDKLRKTQRVFDHTGGLHAAGLFSVRGELVLMYEDVGRHNAFDKLVGAMVRAKVTPENHFILVSGRTSFELVQKCLMAHVPILAGVGSPSSLAVELAKESKLTLLGFVRNNSFNIYTSEERIVLDEELRKVV